MAVPEYKFSDIYGLRHDIASITLSKEPFRLSGGVPKYYTSLSLENSRIGGELGTKRCGGPKSDHEYWADWKGLLTDAE
jgi:hypothetical protein